MKKFNYLDLDGHIIHTFLTILEHSSVSLAAEKLDITQSAVSHTLAKLRQILGDPLFVRSGQGLTPTETALSLKDPVLQVLDSLQGLTNKRFFDPKTELMQFTIAANDMQRDLIFPQLLRETKEEGISIELEFMPSGQPSVTWIRDARCQLAVTPLPPDAPDIFQKPLITGEMVCYYDNEMRDPPNSLEEYYNTEHLVVRFRQGRSSLVNLTGIDKSKMPRPVVTVSNFNSIPPFIKGTRLIATQMNFMQLRTLKELNSAPLPFDNDPVSLYMVWHERSANDPSHIWLRGRIEKIANEIPHKMDALDSP